MGVTLELLDVAVTAPNAFVASTKTDPQPASVTVLGLTANGCPSQLPRAFPLISTVIAVAALPLETPTCTCGGGMRFGWREMITVFDPLLLKRAKIALFPEFTV